jgi:hypothetical protein
VNRKLAIEAMDQLSHQGYSTTLHAIPMKPGWVDPNADENGIVYRVSVHALHFDKVDLKHLCAQGDALGLEVMVGGLTQGTVDFSIEDKTPQVIRNPRPHPR